MSTKNRQNTIECARCSQSRPGADQVPWGGELGEAIRSRICEHCWQEWVAAEVMVINELRLDFMNPESQDILVAQMREFLVLDS